MEHAEQKIQIIGIGEIGTSFDNNTILKTVLGSCVAVLLYSTSEPVATLSHFLLAESENNSKEIYNPENLRYGNHILEKQFSIMDEHIKIYASIQAKIFGGATVKYQNATPILSEIGLNNIAIAQHILNKKSIPVAASHIGGNSGMSISYNSHTKMTDIHLFKDDSHLLL